MSTILWWFTSRPRLPTCRAGLNSDPTYWKLSIAPTVTQSRYNPHAELISRTAHLDHAQACTRATRCHRRRKTGGLELATRLRRRNQVEITLVDANRMHMLRHRAISGLQIAQIIAAQLAHLRLDTRDTALHIGGWPLDFVLLRVGQHGHQQRGLA